MQVATLKSNPSTQELATALKKCGNTAACPDGIGNKAFKATWDIYGPFYWIHGIMVFLPPRLKNMLSVFLKRGGGIIE
jgi:hypothetical protein